MSEVEHHGPCRCTFCEIGEIHAMVTTKILKLNSNDVYEAFTPVAQRLQRLGEAIKPGNGKPEPTSRHLSCVACEARMPGPTGIFYLCPKHAKSWAETPKGPPPDAISVLREIQWSGRRWVECSHVGLECHQPISTCCPICGGVSPEVFKSQSFSAKLEGHAKDCRLAAAIGEGA